MGKELFDTDFTDQIDKKRKKRHIPKPQEECDMLPNKFPNSDGICMQG